VSEARRKMLRIEPVIKVRKAKVDQEIIVLNQIRADKQAAVTDMRESQRKYMEGVDRLNRERGSTAREMLAPLEGTLDYIKNRWYSLYKRVQEIEQREKAQLFQIDLAERDLRAVEKLSEIYAEEFRNEMRRNDQKIMDEAALRKFSRPDA
jgi:flagellar export protein FliJ